jgi:hypothetical protein
MLKAKWDLRILFMQEVMALIYPVLIICRCSLRRENLIPDLDSAEENLKKECII